MLRLTPKPLAAFFRWAAAARGALISTRGLRFFLVDCREELCFRLAFICPSSATALFLGSAVPHGRYVHFSIPKTVEFLEPHINSVVELTEVGRIYSH